jgi:serine/threonine protein kinase
MNSERFGQLRRVFEAALEREGEDRERYLAEACAGDTELAEEVARLLAAHGEPTRLPGVNRTLPRLEGRQIGPYEILRQIGLGGMGTVYLAARADQAFRRRVAIKIIRPEATSREFIARFQREREILATLDHPHIARLLDGGTTEEGWPYFVMEYVDGLPIEKYADEHRLSIAERLKLFDQVCAAVQHAHEKGVVHRDLKPSNIFVNETGEVKLLDFGIARSDELSGLTQTGFRAMTPEYASPEQIRGEEAGLSSDVYALGVVLYELLTGRRPYKLRSRIFHEIARVVCEEAPVKPSTAVTEAPEEAGTAGPEAIARLRESSLVELQSRLKGDLDHVILKALEKQPGQRYLSAEQFRLDVNRYLAGEPVIARPDSTAYRMSKTIARHRYPLIAAVLGGVAIASGAIRIELAALKWVAIAAAVLATVGIATSKTLGRRIAEAFLSSRILGVAAVILVMVGGFVGFDARWIDFLNAAVIVAAAFTVGILTSWFTRNQWSGPLLAHSWHRNPARYLFLFMAILPLIGLISGQRTRPADFGWWIAAAFGFVLSGRLEVRRDGLFLNGRWVRWGRIESWAWTASNDNGSDPLTTLEPRRPDAWILSVEVRRLFPILGPIRCAVSPEDRDRIEQLLSRYLAVWPGASRPEAAEPQRTETVRK